MSAATSHIGAQERQLPMPLFRLGFRPFFLLGAIWAVLGLALWLAALAGLAEVGGPYGAVAWHAHEMIYGFAAAVLAGFLLTAVPGWTMQPKLGPVGLMGLAAIWIAGRFAMAGAGTIGPAAAAMIDLLFLALLFGWTAAQIVAGRNWRNLPVAFGPAILLVSNLMFHLEALGVTEATQQPGYRLGIAIYVLLVAMIGGRIVPAFTRNWLSKQGLGGSMPVLPTRFDMAVILLTVVALGTWVAAPDHVLVAATALPAAVGHVVRLLRWRGWRTLSEPLLWILHLAYLWVPAGLLLVACAALHPDRVPASAALHALTAGVIGTMMLAMMTRATLGHTGRPLSADPATTATYLLVIGSAVLRVAAPFFDDVYMMLVTSSGLLWVAGFLVYLIAYAPKLWGEPVRIS